MPDAHPSSAGPLPGPLPFRKQVLKSGARLSAFVSSKHKYLAPVTGETLHHLADSVISIVPVVVVTPSTSDGRKEPGEDVCPSARCPARLRPGEADCGARSAGPLELTFSRVWRWSDTAQASSDSAEGTGE